MVASESKAPSVADVRPHERLIALLRGQFQPLFALLDAARDPMVLKLLLASNDKYQSLYQGVSGEKLVHFAPYLVQLAQHSLLLEKLVTNGWGKSWGIFLTSDKSLDAVRTHFRHFLIAKTEDGKDLYFRFYDPRVLRVFLPSCTSEEASQFFEPITHCCMESDQPKHLIQFVKSAKGVQAFTVELTGPEGALS